MANKNPERPKDIDNIISQLLNPKETQKQKNKRIQKEINNLLFN
jgi:hypothetical protein